MGDPACWLDRVCDVCGQVADDLDEQRRCPDCATPSLSDGDYQALAEFRAALRAFLHASEEAARAADLTPNQHQLLLAIRGWAGDGAPGVTELADRLRLQVHSTGELIARAETAGLIERQEDHEDRRRQRLSLTPDAERRLAELSAYHRDELRSFRLRLREVLDVLDA
ncbi:MAG TPA: MarR family winged helix-turn-helix transcriptional regulator [Egicoccus sp.]|nr:MarR family winged helix-turn-helix transcriptional regulator [Egicoccus sp.]HSK23983.1 MarR family winged helix-turn-helix transcriptional regulator [Egicoccus sp.]